MVGRSQLAQFDAIRRDTGSEPRRVATVATRTRLLNVRARIAAAESALRHAPRTVAPQRAANVTGAKVFSAICVLVGLACAYYAR